MMKKLISAVLLILLLLCAASVTASADAGSVAGGAWGDTVSWTLDANGLLTVSGEGRMRDFSGDSSTDAWRAYREQIRRVVIGEGVTGVGAYAFTDCTALAGAALPASLKTIGERAWMRCSGLTEITLPTGLESIDRLAFAGSGLTEITVPEGVTGIGMMAFCSCAQMTAASIPEGVTYLEEECFADCFLLESIHLPKSLRVVYRAAFQGCSALTDVWYGGTAADWSKINIGGSNAYLTAAAIHYTLPPLASGECGAEGDNVCWTLYESLNLALSGSGQMADFAYGEAPWADYASQITALSIGEGITSIGDCAFSGCIGLTGVLVPEGVAAIGDRAFKNCTGLTEITLPAQLETIGEEAFAACENLLDLYYGGTRAQWTAVTAGAGNEPLYAATLHALPVIVASGSFGNGFTWTLDDEGILTVDGAGEMADFYDQYYQSGSLAPWDSRKEAIRRVVFTGSVQTVGRSAFWGCSNLESVVFPEQLSCIRPWAFKDCGSLDQVAFPASLLMIENAAFSGCGSLSEIHIPETVRRVKEYAFENCTGLVRATLEYLPVSLEKGMFSGCSHLRSITVPGCVQFFSTYVFNGCSRLADIYYGSTAQQWQQVLDTTFSVLYSETNDAIKRARVHYAGMDAPSNTGFEYEYNNGAGGYVITGFSGTSSDVRIPMEVIEANGSVTQYTRVVVIGSYAFYGEGIPMEVRVLGNALWKIGREAFSGCYNLEHFNGGEALTTIEDGAFANCGMLQRLYLPETLVHIGRNVFSGCEKICSAGPNVAGVGCNYHFGWTESIPENAFRGLTGLTNVSLPATITSIGPAAFEGCTALQEVNFFGTRQQWLQIDVAGNNDPLINATIQCSDGTITYCTLSFDANGGAGAPACQYKIVGEPLLLSDVLPQRGEDAFLGWASAPDAEEAAFQPGDTFTADEDTTLYAVWLAPDLVLPSALKSVEEEAFAGGGFRFVKLPEGAAEIGGRAFADCRNLTHAAIPGTVVTIAENAFEGVGALTILGEAGSAAEEYAQTHQFAFVAVGPSGGTEA